jgi:glucose-6-phosphate isomerase
MAYEALKHYRERSLTFRFVSNVDSTDFEEATRDLDPAETLFIICSETFTTLETMTNAQSARVWLLHGLGGEDKGHRETLRDGFDECRKDLRFRHWSGQHVRFLGLDRRTLFDGLRHRSFDYAGGWPGNLRALPAGFHEMDEHFRTASFERNLPVLTGIIAAWNNDCFGARTVPVLPHEQCRKRVPAHRRAWLPAKLVQVQRDYFGAHTYERTDARGTFHTQWEKA